MELKSIHSDFVLLFYMITISILITNGEEYRLPSNVVPTTYIIRLTIPDIRAEKYSGNELITFNTTEKVNQILIHSSPVHINITNIYLNGYTKVPCWWNYTDTQTEILTISCNQTTKSGQENFLQIFYEASFTSNDQSGFYKVVEEGTDDEADVLTTRLSPTYARRVFPCFDEPSFKATFNFFVTHPSTHTILGNTPIVAQTVTSDLTSSQFSPTPVISTYSIGFLISKLEPVVEKVNDSLIYNIYTEKENKRLTNTALSYGTKLLNVMGEWTGIKYSEMGTKHLCATSQEHLNGNGVNNLGLVVSREEYLLDEGVNTTTRQKQRIISEQANQIAHQWFSNCISLNWWSNTWLNEGFDTFFEYYLPDQVDAEFETGNHFIINVLHNALYEDSVLNTEQLSSNDDDILTSSDISHKFNNLMANKGASIVRMMESLLGQDNFHEKMVSHLNKVKYSNTNPTLLMESLNLENILDPYLYRPGYPLVTVKLNENKKSAVVSQEPFYLLKDDSLNYTYWNIPLTFTISEEKDFSINNVTWLKTDANLTLAVGSQSWIILNIQQKGYYRVNYDDELWTRIIKALRTEDRKTINVINRAQLIDDIFAVAEVGKVSYNKAFQLISYLTQENEYYPWATALKKMRTLINLISDKETKDLLKKTILGWINKAFPNIHGVLSKKHIAILKECLILEWKCFLGDENCMEIVEAKFKDFKESHVFQNYEERDTIWCYGIKNSEEAIDEYSYLMNVYSNSKSRVEKGVLLNALGCMSDTEILKRYLREMVMDASVIPKEDAIKVFEAVSSNSDGGIDLCLEFFEQYSSQLIDRFSGIFPLSNFIVKISDKISTWAQFEKIKTLIDSVEELKDESNIRSLKIIENNLRWSDKSTSAIKYALEHPLPGRANKANSCQFLSIVIVVYYVLGYANR